MTKVILLDVLKDETEQAICHLLMPVARQKEDKEDPPDRVATVHRMRLPDSKAAKKKVPYILHQVITSKDQQPPGEENESRCTIRTIFCVYSPDEEKGGLLLLNLMERVRIRLLQKVVIGDQFELDKEAGLECLVYPEDTAPYFAGEMVTTWKLLAVKREVRQWL